MRLIALHCGVSATRIDERMDDVREAACVAYARLVPDDLSATVAPGVHELLEQLAERDGLRSSRSSPATTSRSRASSSTAPASATTSRPGQGAFGSDAEDRTELPAIARAAPAGAGARTRASETVVIGDTPRDIACARADGVRCLAVATGPFPAGALDAADAVAPDARALRAHLDGLVS